MLGIIFITIINFSLFLGKIIIGTMSGSISLISDALNSFLDTINSIVVLWATKISQKKPDETHPVGHGKAQPLAAFFIAIITTVLAFEVIEEAISSLFQNNQITYIKEAIIILIITIITKGGLSVYEYWKGKKTNNPALIAMSMESRGDVLISMATLFSIIGSGIYNYNIIDSIVALCIGFYIAWTGFGIFKDNIKFLMVQKSEDIYIDKITEILNSFNEIQSFHELRTYYISNKIEVTVHCVIKNYKNYSLEEWHNLEDKIIKEIKTLEIVQEALIHLDFQDDSRSL